ncbi:Precorrin-6A reductase [Candidatus Defluviicoccus seviourii]|uniref:Precorrin-6A reductase n=2 Tax=root TaxID=1 RepID=A0A564WEA8_9PROT|nr:Precorrin-6A reductase [uncultured Defluviicoccus sp.]VUX46810.1 Precorrin-6A reductase [Candidatus Defluviicoccus seviourii]
MPADPFRLLILGGTTEAARLAAAALKRWPPDRLAVITSQAGRIAPLNPPPGALRVGGFGGVAGLAAYLRDQAIDALIDATHPFAAVVSQNAAEACRQSGVARLMLIRPPWQPGVGDRWTEVADMAAAAVALRQESRRVFLTTGPGALPAFSNLSDIWFLLRLFQPPATPLPIAQHAVVVARPPFTVATEAALISQHRIDTLVSKNSGGPTDAKLAAARAAGIRVVMVARPAAPEGERVATVAEALDWLAARLQEPASARGRST